MIGEFVKSSKSNRKLFASLVFFIFSVSLIMTSSAFAAGNQQYKPTTIIDVKWGNAPEEFGLREGGETSGAKTFSLDKDGNIYIFDTVKSNIKKYDLYGSYIGNIGDNNIVGTSFAVGGSGEIYVLENYRHRIHVYSGSGELINDFPIPNEIELIEGYDQKITLDDQDNLYVNNFQVQYHIGKKQNGSMSMIPVKNVLNKEGGFKGFGKNVGNIPESKLMHKREGLKSRSKANRLIKVRRKNTYEASVYLLTEAGNKVKEITMNTSGKFGAVLFKEQDASGYVYVETERITGDNKGHLDVRKYDEGGNLISIFEIPNDYYTTMYKKIEINKTGDVYQLLTTPDGVKIIKWEQSQ